MEEEIRPVIKEVLAANVAVFVAILAALLAVLLPLRLPPFVFYAVLILILFIDTTLLLIRTADAYWVYSTERYAVGEGHVGIRRGWASKTTGIIPSQNIAEVRAVLPLFLRMLSVGLVVIDTNDGKKHVLFNVKYPEAIVRRIRPEQAGELVIRPSVG